MTKNADLLRDLGSRSLQRAVAEGRLKLAVAAKIIHEHPAKQKQAAYLKSMEQSRMVYRMRAQTGSTEWYTPCRYLDAAVMVMGAIDLDPASSDAAQTRVKASRFFTVQDDGLAQEWCGRVFLNPPYAMPHIRLFANKMIAEWQVGRISEGIMLTNSATDTQWFHALLEACTAVCFTRGRIRFLKSLGGDAGTEKTAPTMGQAFFYFGPRSARFATMFSAFGAIMTYQQSGARLAVVA